MALTEKAHTGEFILSEANGQRSRENGTLKTGENHEAGTVLMSDGAGKLIDYAGGTQPAIGVLLATTDASAADVKIAYIARDAEVNVNCLKYPVGKLAETKASLALLGIIVR